MIVTVTEGKEREEAVTMTVWGLFVAVAMQEVGEFTGIEAGLHETLARVETLVGLTTRVVLADGVPGLRATLEVPSVAVRPTV